MSITYEVNPPKIPKGHMPDKESLLDILRNRVSQIVDVCDGIHITESVLGTTRLSPIATSTVLKQDNPDLRITVSMRVIDKDISQIKQYADDVIDTNLDGILILQGDKKEKSNVSGLIPSSVAKTLYEEGYSKKTKLFLSLPNNPDFAKIQKKIDAKPHGFITQVIQSIHQVDRICNELDPKGFNITPIVLLPSEKNVRAAEFLGLDWSGYKDSVGQFISDVHDIAKNVLITSPNDFGMTKKVLTDLAN